MRLNKSSLPSGRSWSASSPSMKVVRRRLCNSRADTVCASWALRAAATPASTASASAPPVAATRQRVCALSLAWERATKSRSSRPNRCGTASTALPDCHSKVPRGSSNAWARLPSSQRRTHGPSSARAVSVTRCCATHAVTRGHRRSSASCATRKPTAPPFMRSATSRRASMSASTSARSLSSVSLDPATERLVGAASRRTRRHHRARHRQRRLRVAGRWHHARSGRPNPKS